MRLRSTPAENARPPPVTTTASASAGEPIVVAIARRSSRSSALTLPCSRRTTATEPTVSTEITRRSVSVMPDVDVDGPAQMHDLVGIRDRARARALRARDHEDGVLLARRARLGPAARCVDAGEPV